MANKEIRIKWLSDDSAIDQSIQRLQQKLKQMNQSSAQIQNIQETGGTLSKRAEYAQKAFQKSSAELLQRESRELEQKQRKESLGLLEKQRELRKIEQAEGNITAEKQKQIDLLKEEINLRSQKVMDIESTRQEIDRNLKEIQGGGPTPPGGGGGPAQPSDRKAMEMFKNLLKSIGVASIINGALNFTQHRLERDRRLLADQGLTAGMASRELREQIRGEGTRGLFFAQERAQAMRMAAQEQRGMGALDWAKIAGGTAAGAAAGSFIPGLGTAAGAIVGGVSAFGGMMAGSSRMYNRMFDQEAYRSMLTREGMEKYEANRRMLELQNPEKSIAFETMQGRTDRFLGMERALGLRGRELYGEERTAPNIQQDIQSMMDVFTSGGFDVTKAGRPADTRGFLQRAMTPYGTQQAFTQQDVERSIQSLIEAGATTAGARQMAGAGLQFQRNLRLGNAQQVMGQLQAAGIETNQTDQAIIKLMSEAVKVGVDASTMPQEMQRMTAITAQLATEGGGMSQSAAATFAAGLTDFTKTGMEGARTAFDEMLERAKQAGGYEGQMGMGFLMGAGAEEAFGKQAAQRLKGDSKLMNALNQLSAQDLEKDPALLQGYAKQLGLEPEQLLEGMRKKDEFKQTRTGTQMEATRELGERIKGMTPDQVKEFIEGEGSELYSRVAMEDIAAYGTAESGKGRAGRRASIIGRARRMTGIEGAGQEEIDLLNRQLTGEAPTGTEAIKAAQATGDIARLDAVNKNLDDLVNAAKKHTVAAEMYNEQFTKFVKYAKESGDALEKMTGQIEQVVDMLAERGYTPSGEPTD